VEMFKNVVIDGTFKISIFGPFAERAFLIFLDPLLCPASPPPPTHTALCREQFRNQQQYEKCVR
jgi:hypothetical protein